MQKHYLENKELYKQRAITWQRARRKQVRKLIRLAKSQPCADCGTSYPYYVMQFDHLRDKKFNISAFVCSNRKIETLLAEIAKCEVVCANCHAERSYQRRLTTLDSNQEETWGQSPAALPICLVVIALPIPPVAIIHLLDHSNASTMLSCHLQTGDYLHHPRRTLRLCVSGSDSLPPGLLSRGVAAISVSLGIPGTGSSTKGYSLCASSHSQCSG